MRKNSVKGRAREPPLDYKSTMELARHVMFEAGHDGLRSMVGIEPYSGSVRNSYDTKFNKPRDAKVGNNNGSSGHNGGPSSLQQEEEVLQRDESGREGRGLLQSLQLCERMYSSCLQLQALVCCAGQEYKPDLLGQRSWSLDSSWIVRCSLPDLVSSSFCVVCFTE